MTNKFNLILSLSAVLWVGCKSKEDLTPEYMICPKIEKVVVYQTCDGPNDHGHIEAISKTDIYGCNLIDTTIITLHKLNDRYYTK